MKSAIISSVLATLSAVSFATQAQECAAEQWSKQQVEQYQASGYPLSQLNLQDPIKLTACLSSTRSEIRDALTYSAFSHWLRNEQLSKAQIRQLHDSLYQDILSQTNDKHGVYLPFAILVYAEVLRVDRVTPYLGDEELNKAVSLVATTLTATKDYRGFSDDIGWRHQIAHTADAVLQLVLNKRLSKAQSNQLVQALISQVSPANHRYVDGESKRLAMPFLYAWMSGLHQQNDMENWLDKVASPAPLSDWGSSYKSEAGLSKRHNTRHFLLELFKIVASNDHPKLNQMQPSLLQALKQIN